MEAIMCDRCGKYFLKVNPHSRVTLKTEFSFIKSKVVDDLIYDLCKECTDEFKEWMSPYGNKK